MRTVIEIAQSVRTGSTTAMSVLEQCLAAIDARNAELNAFVHLDEDAARRSAEAIDAKVAAGVDPGPLAGVPFGVKDLDDCAGMPTTHGSRWYLGRPPVANDADPRGQAAGRGRDPAGQDRGTRVRDVRLHREPRAR